MIDFIYLCAELFSFHIIIFYKLCGIEVLYLDAIFYFLVFCSELFLIIDKVFDFRYCCKYASFLSAVSITDTLYRIL